MKSALFKQLLLFLVWPDVKDELLDITTLDFFKKEEKKNNPYEKYICIKWQKEKQIGSKEMAVQYLQN